MSTVSLYDSLRFQKRDDDLVQLAVTSNTDGIPADDRNLIVKALRLCRERVPDTGQVRGMDITLFKRIPAQAGLGGASGNAVAAIQAANFLWQLGMSPDQLMEVASELGSDVPFFINGGTAFCSGRGEKIRSLDHHAGTAIVIATPPEGLSTAEVFGTVQPPTENNRRIWQAGQAGGRKLFNRLEQFATRLSDWIERLKMQFQQLNCIAHQLSGSGSSYFGVFRDVKTASIASCLLQARLPEAKVFCVQTTGRSVWTGTNNSAMNHTGTTG